MITVRPEQPQDVDAIRCVNEQAFETPAEAHLVDRLRARRKLIASLVAEAGDQVVGHIAFSPVAIASRPELRGVGLGPMAVVPAVQRRGIGSALVRAGLDRCRDTGYDYAVVVGHPGGAAQASEVAGSGAAPAVGSARRACCALCAP